MASRDHVRAAEVAADRAEEAAHRDDVVEAVRQASIAARHATAAADLAAHCTDGLADIDATDADRASERAQAEAETFTP